MVTILRRLGVAVVATLACAGAAFAQGALAPIGVQLHDNNGNPCNGCVLVTFAAGTSTPLATFADATLSTSNGTSVTMDSAGRASVFLDTRLAYKLTLRTSTGTDIWTRDGITGPLSGVISAQGADTRGIQVSRTSADAGISIASAGGSGKTYGLVSDTSGGFTIRDDSDGTPNLQFLGDNITATLTGTFTVSGGLLSVTGAGDHVVAGSVNGANRLGVRNTNSGSGAFSSLMIGNDSAINAGALFALSSGWTTSGSYVADGVSLESTRPGGLSVNASDASGSIRFYAGGSTTPALTIGPSGILTVGGLVSATASPGIGTQHDFALGNASVIVYYNGIGSSTVTGIAGGQNGRQLWVVQSPGSAGSLTLAHENAGSAAANRITSVTGADINVTATKAVQLIYDNGTSRWLAFDVK
jgi:hypothetical protein